MSAMPAEPDDTINANEPWPLPEGWAWSKLGKVLPLEYGKALPERLRNTSGTVAVYGSSGLVGRHTDSLIDGPSIVVGRKGSAGAVFFCNEPCWPIDTAYFVSSRPAVDLRYGFYFLKWSRLDRLDQSTAIPSLNRDIYADVPIPIPPLVEQHRIVKRIDKLFADIAEGEAALERARVGITTWRRALLKAAVTGKLTQDWREKNKSTNTGADLLKSILSERKMASKATGRRSRNIGSLDSASLAGLPEGWVWASIGEMFEVYTGSTPSRAEPSFWNGDIPWVSSGEVAFCRISKTREYVTAKGIGHSLNRVHPSGTVLLAMIGEGKTRGQCAILDIPASNNQNAAAIRVSKTPIDPKFIYLVLQERYFRSRKESQGGNQLALNAQKVASIPIPLPPLEEIREIVRQVDEMLTEEDLAKRASSEFDIQKLQLRQSVLKSAFNGHLVQQYPKDESASVILARQCAELSEQPLAERSGRVRTAK